CDPPEAAACRAGLDRWLPTFGALSAAWAAGEDPAQSAARLLPPAAGVRVADFFFTYWPEEGPDGQPRLESWDPAMLAEVISLPEGGVSRPLRSSMGIHVFRLDRYKPAKLASDPAVRDALRKRICSTRVQEIRDRYVRDLRAAAAVRLPASD
ncbi:MAG: peptidyl-prolyl cis-trans isomerase, partial [Deltaproteobacteria bacterium]|nr:peptidyl-prolyl cis-trans isomerase [Deltaproteobacteria bacterium]